MGIKTTLRSARRQFAFTLAAMFLFVGVTSMPVVAENRLIVESRNLSVGSVDIPIHLYLDNDISVLGYSLSLRVDAEVVTMKGFDLSGSDVEEADWSQGHLLDGGERLVWGVALDISEPSFEKALPPADDKDLHHIGSVIVDVIADADAVTALWFEDHLGSPPKPPAVTRLVSRNGEPLDFSAIPGKISVGRGFVRGDINEDGTVDVSDPITLLNFLFVGGLTIPCHDAADIDDSGNLQITDAIRLLGFLFGGGLRPEPPFPNVGIDETSDPLPACDPVDAG